MAQVENITDFDNAKVNFTFLSNKQACISD